MQNDYIIIENAAQLFTYDPETGRISWKISGRRRTVGGQAGAVRGSGYRQIRLKQGVLCEHRVAWFLYYSVLPECQIDHINRDKADNRIKNLRLALKNEADNMQNLGLRKDNSTGISGVRWHKTSKKWEARILVAKKYVYLGVFSNLFDAACARKAAELEYFTFANS